MTSRMGKEGTFERPTAAQSQEKPGLEKQMTPPSEATKLESSGVFVEYVGSGKLKDKKVLITGGDSGIGRSVAAMMAREGADITITHLPEEKEDAEQTKILVEQEKRSCCLISVDLSKLENCRKVVEEHISKFQRLNVLINNASQQNMCKDFAQIDLGQVQTTFQTNIIQMFAMTKYALPHMSRGDSNNQYNFFGGVSRFCLNGGLRSDQGPGAVYTPIQVDTRNAREMEEFGAKSSMGRPGQPSEVATSFVFLASKEATLFYGQVMHCYPLGD